MELWVHILVLLQDNLHVPKVHLESSISTILMAEASVAVRKLTLIVIRS